MDWAAAQREVMIVSRRAPVVVWKVWNNGNGLVMERSIIRLVRKWQSAFVSGNFSLTACWNSFSHCCFGGGFRFLTLAVGVFIENAAQEECSFGCIVMKRASFFGKEVVWFVTFPEGRKLLTEIGPKGSGPFGFR